jgi:molecular chaperone GrpE
MPTDETSEPKEATAAAAPAEAPAGADGARAPGAFQTPVSMLAKAITSLQAQNRDTRDKMLRIAADFENFKKRSRKEQLEAVRRAEDKLVIEFLPVLDNLERALGHTEGDAGGVVAGVGMVQKQFLALLEKHEIRPFDSLGQPFDPERHEAIQQAHSDAPAGTVAQQLQRGYLRGDKLVRPALVVVSLGPATASAGAKDDAGTAKAED